MGGFLREEKMFIGMGVSFRGRLPLKILSITAYFATIRTINGKNQKVEFGIFHKNETIFLSTKTIENAP